MWNGINYEEDGGADVDFRTGDHDEFVDRAATFVHVVDERTNDGRHCSLRRRTVFIGSVVGLGW